MGLVVKDSGGADFPMVPEGTYVAVCNMVVDLGMQDGGQYGPKQKIYIRWEIPDERIKWEKDGEKLEGPMVIGSFYTASLSEKANLRRDLEAWRNRAFTKQELEGFDVFNILGKACQLSVTHRESGGKNYANVSAIMGLPKGMASPEPENVLVKYSPDDTGQWKDLPEWIQKKINDSVEDLGGLEVVEPGEETPF